MCEGLVSQHPPRIVAPASLNFLAISWILIGVKSCLFPKISFGFDFFYFDVWSSVKEVKCGIEAIKEFKKPYLVGLHVSEGTTLPSGEKIKDVKKIIDENALGVLLSCVSPENFEKNLKELKSLNIPFGFKLNGFVTTKLRESYTSVFLGKKSNPNEILGKRQDLTPIKIQEIAKKFKDAGATILGGCCETNPSHNAAIAKLK